MAKGPHAVAFFHLDGSQVFSLIYYVFRRAQLNGKKMPPPEAHVELLRGTWGLRSKRMIKFMEESVRKRAKSSPQQATPAQQAILLRSVLATCNGWI